MQKIFNQEIRFKADDGSEFFDWEEKKLEDFLNLTLREVPKPNENYLAIGIRSHGKGTFQKPDSEPKKIAMDKLYVVKENDLIVNITFAWESAIAIVKKEDEGGLVSHRFPTYTFNKNLAIVEFFRYVIIQKKFRLMLDLISPGGAGRNRVMSKKDFLKLKWKLPCIEEQNKIANFLSSIDTKIQQTQKQLESSKEFKKSLLQQMFVQ
jgi:type I restriction enzyme S subunit